MAPFAFPPPPPPPPPSALQPATHAPQQHHQHHSSRGSANDHNRGRGRGRGGFNGLHTSSRFQQAAGVSSSWRSGGSSNTMGHGSVLNPQAFRNKRPSVPKPETAPAIPAFGAPLFTRKPHIQPSTDEARNPKKRKRKSNLLGLTPAGEDHESSEEDVDEEARFATNVGKGVNLAFEHKGQTIRLDSAAALKAWIEERRKNFPNGAKVDAAKAERTRKKAEAEARRKQGVERREAARLKREEEKRTKLVKRATERITDLKGRATEKSRWEVNPDLIEVGTDDESSVVSSESDSSREDENENEDEAQGEDDGEDAPEEVNRRSAPPTRMPPSRTATRSLSTTGRSTASASRDKLCTKWTTTGSCIKESYGRCPWDHPKHLRARKAELYTLSERLMEQQMDQDALKLLEAIKTLAAEGLLDDDPEVPAEA